MHTTDATSPAPTTSTKTTGCGGHCQCAGGAATPAPPAPSINGIHLLPDAAPHPDEDTLQELAHTELLRQEAVRLGLLPRHRGLVAPTLNEAERQVLEAMVEAAVTTPQPLDEECQRYYAAHPAEFIVGQAVYLRHILFAVTPGVPVQALTQHADKALLSLLGKDVPPARFTQLAEELSNCPSSAQGGDLGWLTPTDCAPELAAALFPTQGSAPAKGVHPQLIHTRFGLHIIDLLDRRPGTPKTYPEVHDRIATHLTLHTRAKALHQYMRQLIGRAKVQGLEMEGDDSVLVQ